MPSILILTFPRRSFVRLSGSGSGSSSADRAFAFTIAFALARMRNEATGGVAASFEHITFCFKLPARTRFGVSELNAVQMLMSFDVQSMMNPG